MPNAFSDEQIAALGEMLKPLFDTHSQSLQEQLKDLVNTTVSGATKRLLGEAIKPLQASVTELTEWRKSYGDEVGQTVRTQFESLLENLAEQEIADQKTNPPSGTSAETGSGVNVDALREQLAADLKKDFEKQVGSLKKQVSQYQQEAEQERQERLKIAEQQRIEGMKSAALGEMTGLLSPGKEKRLLTLLEMEGRLVEDKESGAYRMKTKDKFGEDVLVPIKEMLPTLLEKEYSEFLPARAGTGTGTTPPGTSQSSSTLQYLRPDMSADELLALASDDKTFDAAVREFSQAVQ